MSESNLGKVTAYADALSAGYTGTREQFCEMLNNLALYGMLKTTYDTNSDGIVDKAAALTVDGSAYSGSALFLKLFSAAFGDSAGSHNSIYRGKYLGTALTSAQIAAIEAGTFDDLFVGDYWTINSFNWRIAHLDYWYRCGDTDCTTHHAVIVPDTVLYTAQMNTTNTTAGGYVGSAMYTTNLAKAKTIVNNAFGSDHILNHREYLTNAVSNGKPSGGAWYDSTVELMNENMCYGSHFFAPTSDGSTIPTNYTVSRGQLALFHLEPRFIHMRDDWFWLRDVVSSADFANVNTSGNADCSGASRAYGVRPAFAIC